MKDDPKPILSHVEELRGRLLFTAFFVLVCAVVAWWQFDVIYKFLTGPVPSLGVPAINLHAVGMTEAFASQMMISVIGGIIGAFPIIIYNICMFILPGLNKQEKKALFSYLPAMIILFLVGCAFAAYPIVPIARSFFLTFGQNQLTHIISISSYLDFASLIVLGMGLVFLLPVVILLITSIGLVSPSTIGKSRKIVWIVILIAAAAIAPNDGLSMIAISLPVVILFEISLVIAKIKDKKRQRIKEAQID
ncbi:MAG TPA: twin-arginine translocase subunit TatC [Caldisericia bacterium]|nr:twin-arginine translocase subunit TatC [Caldisericia bacterium]HPF48999.1 twin-arginine translocase subunit TatC [Caldisericia bacterium]HPI83137.1 twin-arginine translocase subunit TatC [Caldisericia bacterium]HPQ92364.1 twin-arginine translocase subunit TatC [Caldisericia bacterium]HRV74538.1 twin-arginine translocase subunit TatC [Caldisericia bacterium]